MKRIRSTLGAFEWPSLVAALVIAFLAVVVYKVLFE